jgi:hypothetical protein
MIKKIPLDEARPGMILAQQLQRDDGLLLCQKGAELTENLLRVLTRLGFETIQIEVGQTETPAEQAARLARDEAEIEARFVRVASDPILAELKRALIQRLRRGVHGPGPT